MTKTIITRRIQVLLLLILLTVFSAPVYTQITVPVTAKELADYQRESEAMVFMKIDLSQTWLYMVKDNVISSNKLLVQEIYFNKAGLPERLSHYDEAQKLNSFTVIKYNARNLPFEEIKFTPDSTLISGTLFEYDENDLLSKQVNYGNDAQILLMQEYSRSNDSIYVKVCDKNGILVYKSIITLSRRSGEIKNMIKVDNNNEIIERTIFETDEPRSITRKFVYDSENRGIRRDFVYSDEGALIRTVTYDQNSEIMSDSSFEYDEYGNLIRIIDMDQATTTTKMYFIKYLTQVKE